MSQAPEKFMLLSSIDATVREMIRKLNYIFSNLETGDSVSLGEKAIKSGNIDFGLSSTQIKANNIPLLDAEHLYTASEVETALREVMLKANDKINTSGGTFTGVVEANSNTSYTTKQIRNVTLSTAYPSGGNTGDVWFKYIG